MSMNEKISSAQTSDNLKEVPPEQIGDVDIIRACGMVGVQMPLGLSLWRLKYSAATREFPTVVDGLLTKVLSRFHRIDGLKVTYKVIKHWLDDMCHACHGRGYEVVPGTPMLSEKQCEHCGGQGRVKLPEPDDASLWLLEEIAKMERDVASAIMVKLNTKLDL